MWVEKHRGVYRIRELLPDGSKVDLKSGYRTKTAAKEAMALIRADELRGDGLVPRGGERTVAAWCEQWWTDQAETYTKARSRQDIPAKMDRYIVRLLGHMTLADLESTPAIVQRWTGRLLRGETQPKRGAARPLSPTTVRDAHGLLHQILAAAVTARLIRNNPCANTKLPEPVEVEMRFLTPAEADRLVAAMPKHYWPLILFLLTTGCRWGEAIGLRAKNLDVLGRKVRFLKKTVEIGGRFIDEDPKSRRGRRTCGFTKRLATALIPLAMQDDDRERRIFLGPRGGMVAQKRFYPIWHKACADAGLTGLRIHDLRHTHVAWLIAKNVPLSAISRRIGHKSIAVTDDLYGHLLEEVDERLVEGLDEIMSVIDMGGIWGETDGNDWQQATTDDNETPVQQA